MSKRMMIKVETAPNGYSLTVNGNQYFYFNPVSLMEGFIYHVGLIELKNIDPAEIGEVLKAVVLAHADKTNDQKVKQMEALTIQNAKDVKTMTETVEQVTVTMKKIDEKHTMLLNALPAEVRRYLEGTDKAIAGVMKRMHDIESRAIDAEKNLKETKKEVGKIKAAADAGFYSTTTKDGFYQGAGVVNYPDPTDSEKTKKDEKPEILDIIDPEEYAKLLKDKKGEGNANAGEVADKSNDMKEGADKSNAGESADKSNDGETNVKSEETKGATKTDATKGAAKPATGKGSSKVIARVSTSKGTKKTTAAKERTKAILSRLVDGKSETIVSGSDVANAQNPTSAADDKKQLKAKTLQEKIEAIKAESAKAKAKKKKARMSDLDKAKGAVKDFSDVKDAIKKARKHG